MMRQSGQIERRRGDDRLALEHPYHLSGHMGGDAFEDKGRVLQNEPGMLLVPRLWGSLPGLNDPREYYRMVRHEMSSETDGTRLTIPPDNSTSQEEGDHSEDNWPAVLYGSRSSRRSRPHTADCRVNVSTACWASSGQSVDSCARTRIMGSI